jgi:membrane protease YdiL (CAAX protease family)
MSGFPLLEFLVLFGLGLFGALAVIPYAFSINRDKVSQVKMPLPVLALVSFLQTALLLALAVGIGLLAGQSVGLGAPHIQAALAGEAVMESILALLPLAVGLGIFSGALIVLLDRYVFVPHLPEALRSADVATSAWKRFLVLFYGGIDEEILMRLFLVSVLAWVLGRFWQNGSGLPADGAYWLAILLAALLFGLGHLPATKAITPLTSLIVARALLLNGLGGVAFGWLYWQYGLVAAMLAHFCADILVHLIGPMFASHHGSSTPTTEALPTSN